MRASRQPCQRGRSAYGSTCSARHRRRSVRPRPGHPRRLRAHQQRESPNTHGDRSAQDSSPRRAPAPHHDLHRIALRVRDPSRAKRAEEVMRRAQHADALPAEICERRIHIVAPHDDLGPWRAGADVRHLPPRSLPPACVNATRPRQAHVACQQHGTTLRGFLPRAWDHPVASDGTTRRVTSLVLITCGTWCLQVDRLGGSGDGIPGGCRD